MVRREKSNYTIQSVSHALDVMEQFNGNVDEIGVTELSKRLKLHKNNVFRLLATLEARRASAFEAILLNERGERAEGAGSNVFVAKGGVLRTPPLEAGILAGITRDLVFELGRGLGLDVREQTLRAEDLLGAEEAFITSTLKEVTPIARVGDRPIGSGARGELTRRLPAAYREKTRVHED